MKFNHQVIHDGKLYYAGQEVPIETTKEVKETPKPEKVEESPVVEVKVELDGEEVAKTVKKATKKK